MSYFSQATLEIGSHHFHDQCSSGSCPFSLGRLPIPFAVFPVFQEYREGASHMGSWIPLSTTTWFAWFSFSPPPAPVVIVCDEPSDSPKFLHPPSPVLPPLAQTDGYRSHAVSGPSVQSLQYKCVWGAEVQVLSMIDWDSWKVSHQRSPPLPTVFKLQHG